LRIECECHFLPSPLESHSWRYSADAPAIVMKVSGGKQPAKHIYSDVVQAVDGSWSCNGIALTNDKIGASLAKG
jgi:hypothetical protein